MGDSVITDFPGKDLGIFLVHGDSGIVFLRKQVQQEHIQAAGDSLEVYLNLSEAWSNAMRPMRWTINS